MSKAQRAHRLYKIIIKINTNHHFNNFQVFREVKVKDFDASKYEAKQVFYASKDGTKVPMFIVSKKVTFFLQFCIRI